MSRLVHRVVNLLPAAWQSAIERESREWRSRCPKCLRETSVWDLGGVRYKAVGNPVRSQRCAHCGTSFVGQLYRVRGSSESPRTNDATGAYGQGSPTPTPVKPGWGVAAGNGTNGVVFPSSGKGNCRLWIDGVGCYQVLTGEAVTIGSPASGDGPDIAIYAPLSRRQAQLVRAGEGYLLIPVGLESVPPGRTLRGGDVFEVGGGVQLRLTSPNPLSQTAVLEPASNHRFEPRANGVILLDQVCLLGPGGDCHVRSPLWTATLILFRREDSIWCKEIPGLKRNGEAVMNEARLGHGDVLSTDDLRLRVELSCG
jgi:hypothetical protein